MNYLDAICLPFDATREEEYKRLNELFGAFMKERGALSYIEAIADDVPNGEQTDWYRAAAVKGNEVVVVAFITWPDKATRDAAWGAMEEDDRFKDMQPDQMPFDGKRMFWGGFTPIYEMP